MAEVTLATFRPRPGILVRTYPGSGNVRAVPPLDPAGRFPPDGIALRVISDAGSPAFALHNTRLRRPITLASLQPSDGPTGLGYNATTGETPHAGRYHGAPRSRARTIDLNGTEFTIVVWIGPRASAGERRALTRMLASLTFPKPTGS